MSTAQVDPEYERWKRKYPRFPGVAKCVELLKQRNVRGAWIDIICQELEDHTKEHPEELIAAIRDPENKKIRLVLLGPLENAAVLEALPLYAEILESEDNEERPYAIRGLEQLNTKEAWTLLWQADER